MVNTSDTGAGGLGYLADDLYLEHDPGNRHPEAPSRLAAVRMGLEACGAYAQWQRIEPRSARAEELELVHSPGLIERVERASRNAPSSLDPDTVVSSKSYRTALFAAGGVLECVDAVCASRLRRVFAFVRPPGHHAEPDRAMGFCLFNNVALAAAWARLAHRLERIAVVDFDLHHGNGTQACFYDDPHVLFISSHQYPFYPGSGAFPEIGAGEGKGFTVNLPLPEGSSDALFVPLYANLAVPILEQFQPQLILVSAGFDAHFLDPLGGLRVTSAGFVSVAASLLDAADRLCKGRICFVLEGGYSMQALEECTRLVLAEMASPAARPVSHGPGMQFEEYAAEARKILRPWWQF